MKRFAPVIFDEPIFIISGDEQSGLFDAAFLGLDFIILNKSSRPPPDFGKIEFCIPKSSHVISCDYKLGSRDSQLIINLQTLTKDDYDRVLNFVSKHQPTQNSTDITVTDTP